MGLLLSGGAQQHCAFKELAWQGREVVRCKTHVQLGMLQRLPC